MNKNAIRTQIKALELLNKENPFRYPKGSSICFNDAPKNIDGRYLVNCAWCNKKDLANGGDNKVIAPPEWQNIPVEQAEEICMMFDNSMLLSFYPMTANTQRLNDSYTNKGYTLIKLSTGRLIAI